MIATIIILAIAFGYLGYETKGFTIRLLVGKDKPAVDNWTPYYKELLVRDNRPRNSARTMTEWDIYNKEHAAELEQEQAERDKEREQIRIYRASHECPICHKTFENPVVETKTIVAGNSTCHVTGCPDCLEKWRKDIDKSQTNTIRQPVIKTTQLPMFITQERTGSHRDWIETSPKHGYHKTVEEFTTYYHDCLCGKDWLKEHADFKCPEPTIEISINDKAISVNGNYKKGMIAGFMKNCTGRLKMLCYRDTTFCSYDTCVVFPKCSRALTQEIKDKASKFGLPVCQFAEKPDCYTGISRSVRKRLNY